MEFIIDHYGLNFSEFSEFLRVNNGIVAGSSSLAAYLKSENDLTWMPNDIDIWIPVKNIENLENIKSESIQFFQKHSYNKSDNILYDSYNSYNHIIDYKSSSLNHIIEICNFKKDDSFKIQIMFIQDLSVFAILEKFDLSICKIAWDPEYEFITYSKYVLQDIKSKRAHYDNDNNNQNKTNRINKYKERGFKIYVEI